MQTLPNGETQTFPGLRGYELAFDEGGLPTLKKTDPDASPGVARVIGTPGQAATNVPKSEFLKNPGKWANTPGLKVVDDTGLASGDDGKKQLPPAEVRTMTEGASVARMLPEVEKLIDENQDMFGPIEGGVRKINKYDKRAQALDAKIRAVSQAFGRFMEGGVLRKEDEEKYYKMFPQLNDLPEVAREKRAFVSQMLGQQYSDKKNALGASGHDVSGLLDLTQDPSLVGGAAGEPQPPAAVVSPAAEINVPLVTDQAGYDTLPKGAQYKGPDGVIRRKK